MNKFYKLILILQILLIGCSNNAYKGNKPILKKIDSLDMNIFSERGDKIYSITSPNSTYDKVRLEFNLEKTTISIFEGEDVKYVINSDTSTLSDNNNIVELNGNVELRSLNQDNDLLNGDNLIWNINESKYELMGNIRFENTNIKLYSNKAILDRNNIIEFFNPVKYIIKDENNENKYETKAENAYYDIKSESISFGSMDKRVRSIIYF